MANEKGKKTDSKATLGEAVGLASQEQVQAARKAREASENRADKLADRVMMIEKALAEAEQKSNENAGLLADITDVLFEDDERSATNGYIGVLDRAKELVTQVKEATRKCAEETAKALEAQHYAEREAVKAKSDAARKDRINRMADDAIQIIENAFAKERKRRQEAMLEASGLRNALKQLERFARSAMLMLEAIRESVPVDRDGKQFYPSMFPAETADKLQKEFGEYVGRAAEKDTVRRGIVFDVVHDYSKILTCSKCGNQNKHFEYRIVIEHQTIQWCEGKGYESMDSELEDVRSDVVFTCGECAAEINAEAGIATEVNP
jgi:hypothetical protein